MTGIGKAIFLAGFLCVGYCATAQEVSKSDSLLIRQVEKEVGEAVRKMKTDQNAPYDKYALEFYADTARINRIERSMLSSEEHFSTLGMIHAVNYAYEGYDKLLNKYYKLLIGLLLPQNKAMLQGVQRAWLEYRDKEAEFSVEVYYSDTYFGGGTMWRVIRADHQREFVKARVISLFNWYRDIASQGEGV